MDRREFAALFPALVAAATALPEQAGAATLPAVTSGVFKPGPQKQGRFRNGLREH